MRLESHGIRAQGRPDRPGISVVDRNDHPDLLIPPACKPDGSIPHTRELSINA